MQISKFYFVCAVALLGFVSFSVQAQDTPSEAKLREALRQKMAEDKAATDAATPSTAQAPAVAETAPVAKPAKRTRVAKTAPPVSTPVAPAPAIIIAEPEVAPVAVPVAEPVVVAAPTIVIAEPEVAPVAVPVAEPAVVAAPSSQETGGSFVPIGDNPQAALMRQAVRESIGQGRTSAIVTGAAPQPEVLPNTAVVSSSPTVVITAPIVEAAPALPISGSKAERLAVLLQQYKADQITPQQYHETRAKIIAE